VAQIAGGIPVKKRSKRDIVSPRLKGRKRLEQLSRFFKDIEHISK
jgi:hypothetical protein